MDAVVKTLAFDEIPPLLPEVPLSVVCDGADGPRPTDGARIVKLADFLEVRATGRATNKHAPFCNTRIRPASLGPRTKRWGPSRDVGRGPGARHRGGSAAAKAWSVNWVLHRDRKSV